MIQSQSQQNALAQKMLNSCLYFMQKHALFPGGHNIVVEDNTVLARDTVEGPTPFRIAWITQFHKVENTVNAVVVSMDKIEKS